MTMREKVARELASIMQGMTVAFLIDGDYKNCKLEQADRILSIVDEEVRRLREKVARYGNAIACAIGVIHDKSSQLLKPDQIASRIAKVKEAWKEVQNDWRDATFKGDKV